jgi:hypothetical protein
MPFSITRASVRDFAAETVREIEVFTSKALAMWQTRVNMVCDIGLSLFATLPRGKDAVVQFAVGGAICDNVTDRMGTALPNTGYLIITIRWSNTPIGLGGVKPTWTRRPL